MLLGGCSGEPGSEGDRSSPANAETLRALGVDYGQGFALHRPERVLYQRVLERSPVVIG
jgi:hypothetical protein